MCCPALTVWALRTAGIVASTPLAVAIGVALSLAASFAGSGYWMTRRGSEDVLFSDLMIWGWLRRWRAEHQVNVALEQLGGPACDIDSGSEHQMRLLGQLAAALEAGDPYTRGHSRRVARYATMIASRMGLATHEIRRIRTAAAVHDVGKIETPKAVLHKPGRLTDAEYETVKRHPADGARLVEALGDAELSAIVRHHHERLDGKGYPSGLSGDQIPLGSRIIAVADMFDAITSARSYRGASPHKKALDVLSQEAGTQLDADAVRAFRSCYTGRRPLVLWATVSTVPDRLTSWLGSGNTAGALSITKVVAAASTVAVVGGAAASAAPTVRPPARAGVEVAALVRRSPGAHRRDAASPGRSADAAGSSRSPRHRARGRITQRVRGRAAVESRAFRRVAAAHSSRSGAKTYTTRTATVGPGASPGQSVPTASGHGSGQSLNQIQTVTAPAAGSSGSAPAQAKSTARGPTPAPAPKRRAATRMAMRPALPTARVPMAQGQGVRPVTGLQDR